MQSVSAPKRFSGLDNLRALAIIIVFVYHYNMFGHPQPIIYPSAITRFIAAVSYSIYLTHKQLIHLTHEALHHWNIGDDTYISFWISTTVALAGGWLLHVLIEKPFLLLRDRLLHATKGSAQVRLTK